MADAILQKLGACKSLLSALHQRPGFDKTSSIEAQRVQALLRVSPLGTEDLGKVAEAIQSAGFADADAAAILDTVADLAGSGGAQPVLKAKRVTTQDYTEMRHYLVPSVMASLKEEKAVGDLMDHLLRLGLRNPSEPTFQMMTVLVLHATEGYDKTQEMAPATKLLFNQSMKDSFRGRAKLVANSIFYVEALPGDPAVFKREFPSLYAAAFKDSAPMPAPISELEWTILKRGVRMRKDKGGSSLELALASPRGSSSAAMPSNLLQFGQAMAGQMQVLAQEIASLKRSSSSEPLLTLLKPPAPTLQSTKPVALPDSGAVPASSTMALEPPAPRVAPATLPLTADAAAAAVAGDNQDSEALAEEAKAQTSVDQISASIRKALDENKGKAKAKGKGEGQAKAKGKGKAKAKSKAALKGAAIGKAKLASKPPAMPAFKKQSPIYWGSCTIYTDPGKGQWRAIEAANRRRDMKFKWSKEGWQRLLSWCREHGHDL